MYKLYFLISRFQKRRTQLNKKSSKILQRIIDYIETYYNLYIKKKWSFDTHLQLNQIKRDQRIIVSLTSYPKRIDTIWLTITSLFKQRMKPDLIVLWLAKSQFKTLDDLPDSLKRLQRYGLQIRLCDDLKSHKKYYYALQEFNKDIVILTDDDMIYPSDTIEKLYKMHVKYPTDICTMSAQYIGNNHNTVPSNWVNTNVGKKYIHSDEIQIFTGSGSLYPPNCLFEDVFNKDLIKKLCPYADDLWLTYMAMKKGTRITSAYPWRTFPINIYGTSVGSLWYINAQDGKNDIQWKNLIAYYERKLNL